MPENKKELEVEIVISGGVAEVTKKSGGVKVTIMDCDNDTDHAGNPQEYSEEVYESSDIV